MALNEWVVGRIGKRAKKRTYRGADAIAVSDVEIARLDLQPLDKLWCHFDGHRPCLRPFGFEGAIPTGGIKDAVGRRRAAAEEGGGQEERLIASGLVVERWSLEGLSPACAQGNGAVGAIDDADLGRRDATDIIMLLISQRAGQQQGVDKRNAISLSDNRNRDFTECIGNVPMAIGRPRRAIRSLSLRQPRIRLAIVFRSSSPM